MEILYANSGKIILLLIVIIYLILNKITSNKTEELKDPTLNRNMINNFSLQPWIILIIIIVIITAIIN